MNPYIIGALLNSALYLASCFIAGLVLQNGVAWRAALATMGITFLSYLYNIARPQPDEDHWGAQQLVSGLSIALGTIAGLALLF